VYELRVRQSFPAAHHLKGYPGDCARPHGHNFEVEAVLKARALDNTGLAIDFRLLKGALKDAVSAWDHADLNELPELAGAGLNPSAENLARLAYETLSSRLDSPDAWIDRVTIWENAACAASYYDEGRRREREP
jgi:6-pyruvoyltetrahydropterin/6-carboxytetrahydropterin synthase